MRMTSCCMDLRSVVVGKLSVVGEEEPSPIDVAKSSFTTVSRIAVNRSRSSNMAVSGGSVATHKAIDSLEEEPMDGGVCLSIPLVRCIQARADGRTMLGLSIISEIVSSSPTKDI